MSKHRSGGERIFHLPERRRSVVGLFLGRFTVLVVLCQELQKSLCFLGVPRNKPAIKIGKS